MGRAPWYAPRNGWGLPCASSEFLRVCAVQLFLVQFLVQFRPVHPPPHSLAFLAPPLWCVLTLPCVLAPLLAPVAQGISLSLWVVSWFCFLDFALLFHSVSLSLTASGFLRRPHVKGFYSTELLVGPWLCDLSAVHDQREVANSARGHSQQWSVP